MEKWKQVRLAGRAETVEPSINGSSLSPISSALQLCDEEVVYLKSEADIFEPQRTQYIKVVGRWREQIWQRAEDAVGLLDVLDKFNRHTYRASSDRLMSSITELAFQVAPLWLDAGGAKPLQSEIERRLAAHPLVRSIFESGNRLVGNTHLAGTLFAVARDYYVKSSTPASRQVSLRDIQGRLEEFCKIEELKIQLVGTMDRELPVPGTLAVWDTVLQEIVTNVRKYCSAADQRLIFRSELGADRAHLYFAGRRPFIECLHDDYLRELPETLPVTQRVEKLQSFAEQAKKPGYRLASSDFEEYSSGMGLPLILRICRYLGMHADVVLMEPEIGGREVSDEVRLRCPLCVKIDWEELS